MEIKDNNGHLEVDLPAVLDLPAAAELRDLLLDAAVRDTAADVVLNAAATERLSTAAIQVILSTAQTLRLAARRLEVAAPSDAVVSAFRHLGLAPDLDSLLTA